MVFFLLTVFLTAKVEPVLPYLKVLPQLANNLIKSLFSGDVKVLAGVNIEDQDDQDNKTDDKEGEKEVGKSIKEECKMLLHDDMVSILFCHSTDSTVFHLYQSGKIRTHVNAVFRPPLV